MQFQFFEDPSPTIDAALRLQPRCSEKTERESSDSVVTTRLLVPSSRIGCLIGKGGAIISEMRSVTRANIRILSKENLPKIASDDDEMVQVRLQSWVVCVISRNTLVLLSIASQFKNFMCSQVDPKYFFASFDVDQITGELNVASNALLQVTLRLKANLFEREGALAAVPPTLPYLPMSDVSDGSKYGNRDGQLRERGYSSYSGGYGSSDLPHSDRYGSYGGSQVILNI